MQLGFQIRVAILSHAIWNASEMTVMHGSALPILAVHFYLTVLLGAVGLDLTIRSNLELAGLLGVILDGLIGTA